MNRNQWLVLQFSSIALMLLFISLDSSYWGCIGSMYGELNASDVWCIVNGKIYDPFIWLFGILNFVFMICGFLEPKRR